MSGEIDPSRAELIRRLRRIEGQVRGIQTMVAEDRDCREIVQQLNAVRAAVQGASRVFLHDYASGCLTDLESHPADERERLVHTLIDLLDKTA